MNDDTNKKKIVDYLKQKKESYISEIAKNNDINLTAAQSVIVWMYWAGDIEKVDKGERKGVFSPIYVRLTDQGRERYKDL